MNCRKTQLLMATRALCESALTEAERISIDAHLLTCLTCAEEYRRSEQVIRVLQGMPESLLRQALTGASPSAASEKWAVRAGWDKWAVVARARSSPTWGARVGHRVRWATAIAASVALCFWLGSGGEHGQWPAGDQNLTDNVTREGSTATPVVMGVVARVDDSGQVGESHQVLAGQSLEADNRQQLRVWDRHVITMEPGTRLAANQTNDNGCVVALMAGQITVSVNRVADEGVFRVVTPQAELMVTGTVFTVTSTFDRTHLSVSQGTVRMSTPPLAGRSGTSVAMVSAGQAFTSDGVTIARAESADMSTLLAAAEAMKDPVAALQRSSWYRQRFAPLIYLRDYLTRQGVQADDMTLLAISGDLWCLQYPKNPSAGLPAYIHRKAGLERAAKFYGYQVQWLAPADENEAIHLARRSLAGGDLVLTYGAKDQAVLAISSENVNDLVTSTIRPYRFLGEGAEVPYALVCIAKTPKSNGSREQLAQEALADMRALLAGLEDADYLTGQQAVAAWAERREQAQGVPLNDPLLRALHGLAKLGPAFGERCAGLGVAVDASRWQVFCGQLERQVEAAFATATFEATVCRAAERSNATRDLRAAIEGMSKVGVAWPE